MRVEKNNESILNLLNRRTLPVFLMFFFWGFGTGGLWLVRPLFAYSVSDSFLLVALASSVSAAPRTFVGAITGYLADKFGRKPFIILGAAIHITSLTGQFFSETYLPFFLLEILGGTGIAVWLTSSNALLADETEIASRGRAVALRQTSSRIGLLAGPAVAGIVASIISLPSVFLFIAINKIAVIIVTVWWIRESHIRKQVSKNSEHIKSVKKRKWIPNLDLSMFANRAFLALAIGTFAVSMVVGGTGVFRTFFPVQGTDVAGLDEIQVGNLIAISGILALFAAIPSGIAADRYGRKKTLIAGLLITAGSVWLMSDLSNFSGALLAVLIFGLAEAIGTGTVQTYAMDLAPEDKRGAFLGIWAFSQSAGQTAGPLFIGMIADTVSFTSAFLAVVILLLIGTVMVMIFGKETYKRT
tara:strand:- start:289 stop:1530 length:1242 start_codon:yes stop_codon:yes gene_type:complete